MTDDRLPADLWVAAEMRRLSAQGVASYLLRRGDTAGGLVLVRLVADNRTCRLFSQSRDIDGALGWLAAHAGAAIDEKTADAYTERAVARDPDLWVIEVESRDGKLPFEGKIL